MSITTKTITLRVPSDIIYRALKDTRLERLFPEFFIGITRKVVSDNANHELTFLTTTHENPLRIIEKFNLRISGKINTDVRYITETNVNEDNIVVQSIVQTHVANILYSLMMLETGFVNGLMKRRE